MQPIPSARFERKPGLFPQWQPEYAARYIATFPVYGVTKAPPQSSITTR